VFVSFKSWITLINIILVIKSRRLAWAGYVACIGDRRGSYRVSVGNLRERTQFDNLFVDGRIILIFTIKKWVWVGTRLIWLRIGTGLAGSCDCDSNLTFPQDE
jgi:hypothetical protein